MHTEQQSQEVSAVELVFACTQYKMVICKIIIFKTVALAFKIADLLRNINRWANGIFVVALFNVDIVKYFANYCEIVPKT